MPSRRRIKEKNIGRPVLWIGGSGLPGGATGRLLARLGVPLHWETVSRKAADTVTALKPVIVILEADRLSASLRNLLRSLRELRSEIDMIVFQLRSRATTRSPAGIDGILVKDRSLVQQIRAVLQAMEGSHTFKRAGERAQRELGKVKDELERLSHLVVRDDLTSLYNLRFFNRSLDTEHQRATRFGRNYSLIFMDLDGLREVNETRGHLAGGQVLKQVGDFLHDRIRRIDLPARIGGNEFVVICPETTKPAARMVAERLRKGLEQLRDGDGLLLGITTSIGVAAFPEDGDLPEEVLQRADRALYEAKARGKNRVCCWGEFAADGDGDPMRGSVHSSAEVPTLERPDANAAAEDEEPSELTTPPRSRLN